MDLGSNKEATTVTEGGGALASYWRSVSRLKYLRQMQQ